MKTLIIVQKKDSQKKSVNPFLCFFPTMLVVEHDVRFREKIAARVADIR